MPKKITPYIAFSLAMRPKIKEENPKARFGKIAKITGKMWKALSEDEKKEWEEKAKELSEEKGE